MMGTELRNLLVLVGLGLTACLVLACGAGTGSPSRPQLSTAAQTATAATWTPAPWKLTATAEVMGASAHATGEAVAAVRFASATADAAAGPKATAEAHYGTAVALWQKRDGYLAMKELQGAIAVWPEHGPAHSLAAIVAPRATSEAISVAEDTRNLAQIFATKANQTAYLQWM
jgi:hypothetical protein